MGNLVFEFIRFLGLMFGVTVGVIASTAEQIAERVREYLRLALHCTIATLLVEIACGYTISYAMNHELGQLFTIAGLIATGAFVLWMVVTLFLRLAIKKLGIMFPLFNAELIAIGAVAFGGTFFSFYFPAVHALRHPGLLRICVYMAGFVLCLYVWSFDTASLTEGIKKRSRWVLTAFSFIFVLIAVTESGAFDGYVDHVEERIAGKTPNIIPYSSSADLDKIQFFDKFDHNRPTKYACPQDDGSYTLYDKTIATDPYNGNDCFLADAKFVRSLKNQMRKQERLAKEEAENQKNLAAEKAKQQAEEEKRRNLAAAAEDEQKRKVAIAELEKQRQVERELRPFPVEIIAPDDTYSDPESFVLARTASKLFYKGAEVGGAESTMVLRVIQKSTEADHQFLLELQPMTLISQNQINDISSFSEPARLSVSEPTRDFLKRIQLKRGQANMRGVLTKNGTFVLPLRELIYITFKPYNP